MKKVAEAKGKESEEEEREDKKCKQIKGVFFSKKSDSEGAISRRRKDVRVRFDSPGE